ncbi:hypothetical protein [Marinifilum caeruleilacunae]|uniref:Uncharacterized protein n=1 Tax=Marinifilum caeruleilacunae TaxID=2499076 RepID=A0ABX1WVX1_9BACT|nr:hypothetical protein [Marinifilum caeruleilacunae]NOU60156.1 hypothetical protein [Marinifilum caeruleilacunae]
MISTNSSVVNEIKLEEDQLIFDFQNGGKKERLSLGAGYKYVCDRFFKGDLPKDDEVEISIYYVEELVMGKECLLQHDQKVLFYHSLLKDIFDKKTGEIVSFGEVEEVNHKFFDVIAGVPASVIQIDFTKEKFTVLMILRAIMHVLKIKKVEIA